MPAEAHEITLTSQPRHRLDPECPNIFGARCSCQNWSYQPNAPKWTLLAVQSHWMDAGLTGTKGLITDQITGLNR